MPWKLSIAEKPLSTDKEMKRLIMQYAHCTNYYDVGFAAIPVWQEKTKEVNKSPKRKVYKYLTN
jgi:hypothetical protein